MRIEECCLCVDFLEIKVGNLKGLEKGAREEGHRYVLVLRSANQLHVVGMEEEERGRTFSLFL